MAQQDRLFGQMIGSFTLSDVSYLISCESAEIEFNVNTKNARAVQDVAPAPVPLDYTWAVRGTFFVDSTSSDSLWTPALKRVPVDFILQENGVTGTGNTFKGKAIITHIVQRFPDGPQVVDLTMEGKGELKTS